MHGLGIGVYWLLCN